MTIFFEQLARFEHNIACIEGDVTLTYAELQGQIEAKKLKLQSPLCLGHEKPHKRLVAIVPSNSIATLVNYLALLQLRHAIMFVSLDELNKSDKDGLIADFHPDLILHGETLIACEDTIGLSADTQASNYQNIQDNVALLLSTSGSTGESKQVVLSYNNLIANCESICAYLPLLASDVTITTLPFQYSYGLSIIHTHLAVGATIVLNELSPMQRDFWTCFKTHKVSSFGGVPHSYDILLRLKFTQQEWPSLRYFTQAGGKLAENKVRLLAQYAKNADIKFYVMYGQTEASARMSFVEPDMLLLKPASIGKAIPGGELFVSDDSGRPVQQINQTGQLVYVGDNIMLNYASTRAQLSHLEQTTSLQTGDIAYVDADGDFFITGRKKRMVKLFGERISLDQIEVICEAFFAASSEYSKRLLGPVAVIGDDKKIIIILPYSLQGEGNTNSHDLLNENDLQRQQSLKKFLQSDTGIHPSAVKVVNLESLPLLESGKTDYQTLKIMFMDSPLVSYQQRFETLMKAPAFSLDKQAKQALLTPVLSSLHHFHLQNCLEYKNIFKRTATVFRSVEALPYLAVRMFKLHELSSVDDADVFRVLHSSGTSGQTPARIVLDKATSSRQSKTLVNVMQSFIGKQRVPMLVIDTEAVAKGSAGFSARTAGIQGMAFFGRKPIYALDDNMTINWARVDAFFAQNENTPILIFGFTFMIWQYFIKALQTKGRVYQTSNASLVHSGGWKKLEAERVENTQFKNRVRAHFPAINIHNFYGMAEQVGSVFVECEEGHLHAPNMADIIIRNPYNLAVQAQNEEGIIQVVSAIPSSYPGHSILTEDRGRILGEDDCLCGRKGKYVEVLGRLPQVEVRGCSDTHEQG